MRQDGDQAWHLRALARRRNKRNTILVQGSLGGGGRRHLDGAGQEDVRVETSVGGARLEQVWSFTCLWDTRPIFDASPGYLGGQDLSKRAAAYQR